MHLNSLSNYLQILLETILAGHGEMAQWLRFPLKNILAFESISNLSDYLLPTQSMGTPKSLSVIDLVIIAKVMGGLDPPPPNGTRAG